MCGTVSSEIEGELNAPTHKADLRNGWGRWILRNYNKNERGLFLVYKTAKQLFATTRERGVAYLDCILQ